MTRIPFPPDYDSPPVLAAADRLRHLHLPPEPRLLIFCPQTRLLEHARKRWKGRAVQGFFGQTFLLACLGEPVAVAGAFGVGAPVVGVLVEEFAAWGVRQFAWLGLAGGLQPALSPGDLVLAAAAVRDEGTSDKYLPPEPTIAASPALTTRLQTAVRGSGLPLTQGITWSTDAPYRETFAAVAHYQAQGVKTVEMEAAALFAVAHCCGVEAAALLAVSDSLANGRWQPASNPRLPEGRLIEAFDAIVQAGDWAT